MDGRSGARCSIRLRGWETGRGVHWLSRRPRGRWSSVRPVTGHPDAPWRVAESPSPVRTTPNSTTSAAAPENLTLLVREDRAVAGRDDLVAEAIRQAVRLEHDVAEVPR